MPTPIPINKDQRTNRKTALMVLAAKGEDVKMDSCPLPEKMALLVEGKMNGEDKKRIFAHLSRCETCFEEWINISELQKEKTHTPLLHLNRRVLSYAGSALAVAASITVFLNISQQPTMEIQVLPSPSMSYESESKQKKDTIFLETTEKDSAVQSLQYPQVEQQVAPSKSKSENVPQPALQSAPARDLAKPTTPTERSFKRKEQHAKKTVFEKRMGTTLLTTYLSELRFGCSTVIKPRDFWLKQLAFGTKQFPDYMAGHPQLHAILLQLSREEAQEEQCRLLLEELNNE